MTVDLIPQTATRELVGGELAQCGDAGQKGGSCPSRAEWAGGDFLTLPRKTHNLNLEWFVSESLHVMFLECG